MGCGIATKCIYGDGKAFEGDKTGAISFPIYQTATYAHPEVGRSTGFDYSRLQNPTRQQVENVVASLEGGVDALAFSTGMAAITMLMELFRPGDHIITDADLYGGNDDGSKYLYCHLCAAVPLSAYEAVSGREQRRRCHTNRRHLSLDYWCRLRDRRYYAKLSECDPWFR